LVHKGCHELLRLQTTDLVLVVGQVVGDFSCAAEDPNGFVLVLAEVKDLVFVPQVADFVEFFESLLLVLGAVDDLEDLFLECV